MVCDVNVLVDVYIWVKLCVIEIMGCYVVGDLVLDMEWLFGEKVVII